MQPINPKAKNLLKTAAFAAPSLMLLFELASGGQLRDYLDKETVRALLMRVSDWGPGFMILFGAFLIVREYAPQMISAQVQQASAMSQVAEGLKVVSDHHAEEADDRREVLINLRVLSQKIDELKEGLHHERV